MTFCLLPSLSFASSFEATKKKALSGNAKAQYNLAYMYLKGQGVAKDYKDALKWFKKSALQGHTQAQYNLAVMYDNGEGVAKNYKGALKWYKKAAMQGDALCSIQPCSYVQQRPRCRQE